jgi:hypothetical protein
MSSFLSKKLINSLPNHLHSFEDLTGSMFFLKDTWTMASVRTRLSWLFFDIPSFRAICFGDRCVRFSGRVELPDAVTGLIPTMKENS